MSDKPSPAEEASTRTLAEVNRCLNERRNFLVEAGAGAGKTFTLVETLRSLVSRLESRFAQRHQKIACITFTNVAKDEIDARTDRSPIVYCNTVHAFSWALSCAFQKQLREMLPQIDHWRERLAEVGGIGDRSIEYELGHRTLTDRRATLHHDDVLVMAIALMGNAKFRKILADRFPLILIDEYQDTNADWVDAIKEHFLGQEGSPQFGFFGDHWQKIYGDGCGRIEHSSLTRIGKQANFRSVPAIVDCLNRMRPELPQFVADSDARGSVQAFHTNAWPGARQTGAHWGGDLPTEVADLALRSVLDRLRDAGWDLSPESTKILMLTHRALAGRQGYPSLPEVFEFNSSFTNKENSHIAYFADVLEPACAAYLTKRYGEMFRILGSDMPAIRSQEDKVRWAAALDKLIETRDHGTVGDVVDLLLSTQRPAVTQAIERREREFKEFNTANGEELPRSYP